ncbi:MAG: biotin--[acetyl-CoA-carboxylase] ligase [Treponema sp.]|jgi:BirA family biotin operon repressor/biotin-[acetyl-CoA-carboxylase] ligase|nr:biotin--[acetyl-CoA-carboxylase] ligase [Treponema sp.]
MDSPGASTLSVSTLDVANPFGAPIYYRETLASTMDEARSLAGLSGNAPHGTVIAAGCQTAGRGRGGRFWNTKRGSLPFTVILRYPGAIPPGLTLRAGLALSLAIEDFMEDFAAAAGPVRESPVGRVQVKWPNDIMLIQKDGRGKKAAGVLAEAGFPGGSRGGVVYLGMGVNAAQREFPPELAEKACSIAGTLYPAEKPGAERAAYTAAYAALEERRFILLGGILARLYAELGIDKNAAAGQGWRERLLERLYMRGKQVRFIPGAAGSGGAVEGILKGIGGAGELLIEVNGTIRSFITGELEVYESFKYI